MLFINMNVFLYVSCNTKPSHTKYIIEVYKIKFLNYSHIKG